MNREINSIFPKSFEPENHWYPKALNSTIHPMINFFMNLSKEQILNRYCHLHPMVDRSYLHDILSYQCKYFLWCGADLINSTSDNGFRKMVIIENNSSPSGNKSMPLIDENKEDGSYRLLIDRTFKFYLKKKKQIKGCLAVIYDKNHMEASGYAHMISDVFNETCYLVPYFNEKSSNVKYEDQILYIKPENEWVPVRAAFKYVTQKPWNRIPIHSKTVILNPIIACLAGGRNKMLAAKAYDLFNTELSNHGLSINIPETIWDVNKEEIPLWVEKMGGHAVVKVPYSNAGQGVFTITSKKELEEFMESPIEYTQYIVQSLIGNYTWSSTSSYGKFYHVGTIPNAKGNTYVNDIRMMVSSTETGIKPLSVYSRRALKPLENTIMDASSSWDMLGTNLSNKIGENEWTSDTSRLLLMDRRDFNKLGLGLDDLIECYIQTILSMIAIDKMAIKLHNSKGKFRSKLFKSLNNDSTLISEILNANEKI
jgi:hypothetical protein